MRDVDKLESLTDGFTYFQLVQKTMSTFTQYMSANITLPPQDQFLTTQYIHIDTAIAKAILQKGTRGSFHHWVRDDYDLAVTMLQKTHTLGGFGLTPNVLAQISAKVTMASRFLKLVGSLPLEEWIQIVMFRPIRLDHTNCLQVSIKTHITKTLAPESTSPWPWLLDYPALSQFKNGLWHSRQ